MSKQFDPLGVIPSARILQEKLAQTREQARRLEILLDVAIRMENAPSVSDTRKVATCK